MELGERVRAITCGSQTKALLHSDIGTHSRNNSGCIVTTVHSTDRRVRERVNAGHMLDIAARLGSPDMSAG